MHMSRQLVDSGAALRTLSKRQSICGYMLIRRMWSAESFKSQAGIQDSGMPFLLGDAFVVRWTGLRV